LRDMIDKSKLIDAVVVIIGITYLIGLCLVPELIGNRYNY